MTLDITLGFFLVVGLFAYLCFALLRPENF